MKSLAFDNAVAVALTLSTAACSLEPLTGLTGGSPTTSPSPTTDAGTSSGCSSCADGATDPPTPADAGLIPISPGVDASNAADSSPADSSPGADAPEVEPPPPPIDAGPCIPPAPTSLDVCTGFGELPAPPVIDGTLDCGVPLWSMPMVISSGPGPMPGAAQAVIGAAWRPNGLYLYVSVSGAGPDRYPAPASEVAWCGDAVELFVDSSGSFPNAPSYNDPGTSQLVAGAPATTAQTSKYGEIFRNGDELGPWNGQFVTKATADGFFTEAFITASDLGLASWSLGAGGQIGLDVSIDLGSAFDPGGCARLGQYTIQLPIYEPTGCAAGCDVGEFCTPQLE